MDENTQTAIELAWLLWRSIWYNSTQDWGPYRRRIWDMYTARLRSAARMSRHLGEFVSQFCRAFAIPTPGATPDEREHIQAILDLPPTEHRAALQCFLTQLPVITLYVRLRRDASKSTAVPDEVEPATASLADVSSSSTSSAPLFDFA